MSPEPILKPMLASLVEASLDDPQLVYEPKYDGIRAIAEIGASKPAGGRTGSRPQVRLWSRLGNEKTQQFPDIVAALEAWAEHSRKPVVIDGEIVALDDAGRPAGFQQLQRGSPSTAFIAFDLLRVGPRDLRERPFLERRAALEDLLRPLTARADPSHPSPVRISEMVRGDGRALYTRALAQGWEGLIAKRADSRYVSGKRTSDWRKLKIVQEQEFVIGGWTEPRQSRSNFGALLLGVYEQRLPAHRGLPASGSRLTRQGSRLPTPGSRPTEGSRLRAQGSGKHSTTATLVYAGHTGTGFDERELARLMKLMKPLETKACPFEPQPDTNERPHWVKPELVAQIKFTEWTADGRLRHPVYLGLRDDKPAGEVFREAHARLNHASTSRLDAPVVSGFSRTQTSRTQPGPTVPDQALIDQLRELEDARRDGVLALPGGGHLQVTNLHKVFWPKLKLTKGDLFRYYVQASPCILPAVADRPLVMKRFPNGITGAPFYQHRAEEAPPGVRVEAVYSGKGSGKGPGKASGSADAHRPQLVGGNLTTLLYMTQLAAISQDPWFSRVSSPEHADYVALDLDPPEGMRFSRVLEVARWIRDELEVLGATSVPKTSGADGLHICIPMPPDTPYEAGLLFCQIIATVVSQKHPKAATIERSVKARGSRVYVDYLQNVLGKTLATAYSARASVWAGVSTPLTWQEVDDGVRREDFTIETMPARIQKVGDLWAALRESKGVDLSKVSRYTARLRG